MNTLDSKYELKSKKHRQRIIKNWVIVTVVAAIIIWAFAGIPGLELKSKSIEILKSIFYGLFHPDLSYIYIPDGEDLLRGLLETFAICSDWHVHCFNYMYSFCIFRS